MKVDAKVTVVVRIEIEVNGSELAALQAKLLEAWQYLEGDNGGPLKSIYEAVRKASPP